MIVSLISVFLFLHTFSCFNVLSESVNNSSSWCGFKKPQLATQYTVQELIVEEFRGSYEHADKTNIRQESD